MEAIMPSTKRMMMEAALATAIVSVSAIWGAAAVEQTPVKGPQPLVHQDEPLLSETVSDREQLKRYFLEDWRFQLRR